MSSSERCRQTSCKDRPLIVLKFIQDSHGPADEPLFGFRRPCMGAQQIEELQRQRGYRISLRRSPAYLVFRCLFSPPWYKTRQQRQFICATSAGERAEI